AFIFATSLAAADTASQATLSLEGAKKAGEAAEAYAAKVNSPGGAIAVVDSGGHLLYFVRRAGTFLGSPEISIGKARTAVEFKKPTRDFEEIIAKGRFAMTALPNFTPLQGGIPIVIDGEIVGAIGVSGAKSAAQDEEIALAGAAAFAALASR
ncbi:MAG: heme-binding protein, partial [Opitutaceae bacterium]